METTNPRKRTVLLAIVAFFLMFFYFLHLNSKLNATEKELRDQKKQTKAVEILTIGDARKINDEFIGKFFTYDSAKARYKGIQSLMTEQGYKSTFPSGMELPEYDGSVKSVMKDLKAYEYQLSKNEAEFFNEFNMTIKVGQTENTQTVICRTFLIYTEASGWKINDVEFIGQLTARGS